MNAAAAVATDTESSQTLVAVLRDYSDVYLDCRGIQHRWDLVSDLQITEKREDGDLVERHHECANCQTLRRQRYLLRTDRWSVHRLEVLGASYQYPEGYLMPEMGHVEHSKEVLRYEQFTRALNKPKKPSKKAVAKKATATARTIRVKEKESQAS